MTDSRPASAVEPLPDDPFLRALAVELDRGRDLRILRARLFRFIRRVQRDNAPPLTHEDAVGLAVLRVYGERARDDGPRGCATPKDAEPFLRAVLAFVADAIPEDVEIVARGCGGDVARWFGAWLSGPLADALDRGEREADRIADDLAEDRGADAKDRFEKSEATRAGRLFLLYVATCRRTVTKAGGFRPGVEALLRPMLDRGPDHDEMHDALATLYAMARKGEAVGFFGKDGALRLNRREVRDPVAAALDIPRREVTDSEGKVRRRYRADPRPAARPGDRMAILAAAGDRRNPAVTVDVPSEVADDIERARAARVLLELRSRFEGDAPALADIASRFDGIGEAAARRMYGQTRKSVRHAAGRVDRAATDLFRAAPK
jgi:hypothetical protein